MTDMKRITLTLPDEAAVQLKAVKREMFYDKSHAEMYRWLIAKGLETASKSLKAKGENKE